MKRNDYQEQLYANADNRKIWIRCVPGNDGGRQQSLHLIGLISDYNWQKYWNLVSKNNFTLLPSLIDSLEKLSLLSKIGHSLNKMERNENIIAADSNVDSINNVRVIWNIIYGQTTKQASAEQADTVWFPLANFTRHTSYDLIVYSKNSIGASKPLVFFNVTVAKIFDNANSSYSIDTDKSAGMIIQKQN